MFFFFEINSREWWNKDKNLDLIDLNGSIDDLEVL